MLKMRDQPLISGLFLPHQKCCCTFLFTTGTRSDCEFIDKGHYELVHPSPFKGFDFTMRTKHAFTFRILSILKLIEATLTEKFVAVTAFNWFVHCARNTNTANELFNKVNIGQQLFDLIRLSFQFALLSKLF